MAKPDLFSQPYYQRGVGKELIWNTLTSVGIFVALFIVLELIVLPENTLLGLIVSLIVGTAWWLMQQLLSFRSHIDERLDRVSEAAETYEAIAKSAVDTELSLQMLRKVSKVDRGHPGLLSSLFDEILREVSSAAENLTSTSGNHVLEGEDERYLLMLTRATTASIMAVSEPSIDGAGEATFWDGDLGRRYLQAQRDAIERDAINGGNVQIRRVFIVSPIAGFESSGEAFNPSEYGTLIRRVIEKHQLAGINCRFVIRSSDLPVSLSDSILFDDCIYYKSSPAAGSSFELDGRQIAETRLTRDRTQIDAFKSAFESVWAKARTLDPLEQ